MTPLVNHLLQSSLCAAVAWLLTLALSRNRAAVRYRIWLAASMKFLIPFAWLVDAGSRFAWRTSPAFQHPHFLVVFDGIRGPLGAAGGAPIPPPLPQPPTTDGFPQMLLVALWLCGFSIGVIAWFLRWRRIRAAQRMASVLPLDLPIHALSTPARLEPGVFGIFRPVLLLPEGIAEHMTRSQLDLILEHELCHVRRRDNLTGALHMVVETIFWFHPMLWWIRARLVEERERACDEEVLKKADDPNVYAEGILNVCKFYLASPLACASGVSGADLRKRIESIVENRNADSLSAMRKIALAMACLAAVCGPFAMGVLGARPASAAIVSRDTKRTIKVTFIKKHRVPDERFRVQIRPDNWRLTNVSLDFLLGIAYDLRPGELNNAPGSISTQHYDIEATLDDSTPAGPKMDELRPYLQALLQKEFQLKTHREKKEMDVYLLNVANTGARMTPSSRSAAAPMIRMDMGRLTCSGINMDGLARELSRQTGRPVLNQTGLSGTYDFDLNFQGKGVDAPPITAAVQQQLGLTLDSRKAPVDVLVVDNIARAEKN
ncbi:MAG TPA: M56 family metallopeptidase [Bryobacteraceae bacterium]|jgi:uncharacterized protein (TIGR03435 family)